MAVSRLSPALAGILSDDLTGANAVAAMCAARGTHLRRAVTLLGLPAPGVAIPHAQVLVVDTATRDAAPGAAADMARAGTVWLREAGARLIAKRIDSTLRGPIGAEVAAMLAALDQGTVAVVVPAAPEAGRVALGGRVYLDGRPLSEVTGGPDEPLALMAAPAGGRPGAAIALAVVQEGPEAIRAAIEQAAARGARVVVCDARTDADVRDIAAGVAVLPFPVLPVDPGGFTLALAEARGRMTRLPRPPAVASAAGRHRGPVRLLALLGSTSTVTEAQVRHACAKGCLALVTVEAAAIDGPVARAEREVARVVELVRAHDAPAVGVRVQGGLARPRAAVAALASIARATLSGDERFAGLYLSGGATARAVLERLGAHAVEVVDEVLPLAALGVLAGGPHAGLRVVTKGGMVGGPDAIARCLTALSASVKKGGWSA